MASGKAARIRSTTAYDIVRRELTRYLDFTVRGRSFLIAGHRGAGKTSMIRQAIDDAHLEVLKTAEALAPTSERASRQAQRPLLVLLHGPSLLCPTPARTPDVTAAPPPASAVTINFGAGGAAAGNAGTGQSGTSDGAMAEPLDGAADFDPTASALPQIMVALYRALASEVANAYANHARLALSAEQAELLELAAQLRLDLDMEPDQALLRDRWQRIRRLTDGVLWPPALGARGPADQGVREIAALATAAQAFQACAGQVEVEQSASEHSARDASVDAGGRIAARDIGNTAAALLGGVAIGLRFGAVAGAMAGLAGLFALRWSTKRTRLSSRGFEYRFLPDRSVQTLDRDLPLVVQRLRDIGLAPVFVIDELDKLKPGLAEQQLGALIKRLKQFTTDYGFFCFLVDRIYFNAIQLNVADNPYAPEHTYFSHRLFIQYGPEAMAGYVLNAIETSGEADDAVARVILAKVILHNAEFNFMDVVRELARRLDSAASIPPAAEIVGRAEYRLTAVVQMATEYIMRQPILRARMIEDATFAQLAIDTVYRISRAWRAGLREIGGMDEDIIDDLLDRLAVADDGSAASRTRLLRCISLPDLDVLLSASRELVALLSDFGQLRMKLEADAALPADDGPLLSLLGTIPLQCLVSAVAAAPALGNDARDSVGVRNPDGHSLVYRFMLDRFGINETERNLIVPGGTIAESHRVDAAELLGFIDAFEDTLHAFGIQTADLAAVGAVARTLPWGEVHRVREPVRAALLSGIAFTGLLAAIDTLRSVRPMITHRSAILCRLVPLAAYVRRRAMLAGYYDNGEPVLAKLARVIALDSVVPERLDELLSALQNPPLPTSPTAFATAAEMRPWREGAVRWLEEQTREPQLSTDARSKAWAHWAAILQQAATLAPGIPDTPIRLRLDDLVLAAAGEAPSRLLVPAWPAPAWSWSELALEGAMTAAAPTDAVAPIWALLAGLRARGFDGALLHALRLQLRPAANDSLDNELARLIEDAPPADAGVLCAVTDKFNPGQTPTPCLIVQTSDINRYRPAILWLAEHQVIEGMSRGRT